MADVSVTAGNVVAGSDAVIKHGVLGATVTAGQTVYLDTADGRFKLYDADSATVLVHTLYGVALNGGSSGQPVAVQTGGSITIGGTVTQGLVYVGSDTPGGIMPAADLEAGDFTAILGVATSASVIKLGIVNSGVSV